jgi:hypothetical protein
MYDEAGRGEVRPHKKINRRTPMQAAPEQGATA